MDAPGFYVCVMFIEKGSLQLKGLLQHIVSGVLVLTAHQQRNIQIAGGDEQNLDVNHSQCVQARAATPQLVTMSSPKRFSLE